MSLQPSLLQTGPPQPSEPVFVGEVYVPLVLGAQRAMLKDAGFSIVAALCLRNEVCFQLVDNETNEGSLKSCFFSTPQVL